MFFIRVFGDDYQQNLLFEVEECIDCDIRENESLSEYECIAAYRLNCMAEILNAFGHGNNILFQFTEYDKMLNPDKDEMAEGDLISYHKGCLYDKDEYLSCEVKKVLVNYYNGPKSNEDVEDIKNQLLINFKKTKLEDIDDKVKNAIKGVLYNKCYITRLTDYSKSVQEFVNKRLAAVSYEWKFPSDVLKIDEPIDYIRDLWVNANGKDEVEKWFDEVDDWFSCIITKDKNIYNYLYYINHRFEEWEKGEQSVISVLEREKGDFVKNILPKIQSNLKIRRINYEDYNK